MSVRIGFHGGTYFNVADDYDDVRARHRLHVESGTPYGVTLQDGMYGKAGTLMRVTVNPASIAYIQDIDGKSENSQAVPDE